MSCAANGNTIFIQRGQFSSMIGLGFPFRRGNRERGNWIICPTARGRRNGRARFLKKRKRYARIDSSSLSRELSGKVSKRSIYPPSLFFVLLFVSPTTIARRSSLPRGTRDASAACESPATAFPVIRDCGSRGTYSHVVDTDRSVPSTTIVGHPLTARADSRSSWTCCRAPTPCRVDYAPSDWCWSGCRGTS